MRGMLFHAHSGLRYLVLLLGIVTVAYLAWATLTRRPYDATARKVMAAFTGVVDLQVLIGVLLLFQIPFYAALMGHLTMMIAAVVVAHAAAIVNRRRPQGQQSHGLLLGGALVTMLLILGGIMAIGRPILGSM